MSSNADTTAVVTTAATTTSTGQLKLPVFGQEQLQLQQQQQNL